MTMTSGPAAAGTSRPRATGEATALSVHGPHGVLDLTVPTGATVADVARTYAVETGRHDVLPLVDRSGRALPMTTSIVDAGLVAGSVVVAVDPRPARPPGSRRAVPRGGVPTPLRPGAGSAVWLAVAVGVAVAGAWSTAGLPMDERVPGAAVLAVAALLGCVPVGALAPQRALAAPAFAAAAVFALRFEPVALRVPVVLGLAALAAAVTAALARALADPEGGADEGLRVWVQVGVGWFLLAGAGALLGLPPQAVWAVLLVLAVLASRFVPTMSVDVPDQYLLDLERLAVTAWSARERPPGRRGRAMVSPRAVEVVAARGTRLITASSIAVLVVVAISAPALLVTAPSSVDGLGARLLVGASGATLLLAARTYRHSRARSMLRTAGVLALVWLAAALLGLVPGVGGTWRGAADVVAIVAVVVAALLVVVAVQVGRGWRSAWWSRRAEVAEAVCGSVAVASLVLAVGLFRQLWEVTG